MAHTNHTTTNQIRQPEAITVRSIETSSVSVPWANARMRETYVKVNKRWDVFDNAEVCGVWRPLRGRLSQALAVGTALRRYAFEVYDKQSRCMYGIASHAIRASKHSLTVPRWPSCPSVSAFTAIHVKQARVLIHNLVNSWLLVSSRYHWLV
jgi:hypothetical protein